MLGLRQRGQLGIIAVHAAVRPLAVDSSGTCAIHPQGGLVSSPPWPEEQAARVNDRALDEFLASIERRALRIAEIATRNREEALDLVQDSMFKLAQHYAQRPPEEWAPLFHRILQTRIRDWYRRQKVMLRWRSWLRGPGEREHNELLQELPDPYPNGPAQRLADSEFAAALEEALAALPLRQQQAFLLRVWEGLDVAQTAQAMGCSEGSVKTHFSRAVHTLRGKLGEHHL
jgi:RNA polymerase sigma-70 factor (ECF subfamily)